MGKVKDWKYWCPLKMVYKDILKQIIQNTKINSTSVKKNIYKMYIPKNKMAEVQRYTVPQNSSILLHFPMNGGKIHRHSNQVSLKICEHVLYHFNILCNHRLSSLTLNKIYIFW